MYGPLSKLRIFPGRWTSARGLLGGVATLLAGLLGHSPTAAAELTLDHLRIERGTVVGDLGLAEVLDPETRRSVENGLPITLRLKIEVWRDRRSWFDKQIDARVETWRITWDPGDRRFLLIHPGPRLREEGFDRLSELLDELFPRTIEIYPRWDLESRHRYFAIVEVAIQPITLEEFREIDGWIRGRIREGDRPDPEPGDEEPEGEGLAGAIFGFLVDLSGFGDTIHRVETDRFRVADLPSEIRTPESGP
ncbi:MAG: DUF4390 domain-containing protein [Gemmatimonadetes bacterium]|nr:DUF4390 domain-containing protein [Gemmatimonadota bacterium]